MTGDTSQLNITEFKRKLRHLEREIGKILNCVLEKLAFKVKKDCYLAPALDEETVKIPWELALIRKSLTERRKSSILCDIACIGRLRVVKADSWKNVLPKKSKSKRALVVGVDYKDLPKRQQRRRRHLTPLKYAEKEAEIVTDTLERNDIAVKLLLGKKATFNSVIKELKRGVDIFHFTGHGSTSRNKSKIYLYDKYLSAENLEKILARSTAPSLSFFNACETSVDAYRKGKVSWAPYNWAFALASEGGSVFIGTLWSVFEKEALRFAEIFYRKFLGVDRNTVSDAMRQARNKIKRSSDAILSWLAYVLYGPPTLKTDDLFVYRG